MSCGNHTAHFASVVACRAGLFYGSNVCVNRGLTMSCGVELFHSTNSTAPSISSNRNFILATSPGLIAEALPIAKKWGEGLQWGPLRPCSLLIADLTATTFFSSNAPSAAHMTLKLVRESHYARSVLMLSVVLYA